MRENAPFFHPLLSSVLFYEMAVFWSSTMGLLPYPGGFESERRKKFRTMVNDVGLVSGLWAMIWYSRPIAQYKS